MNKYRVLAVHGVGRHETDGDWQQRWHEALTRSLTRVQAQATVEVTFLTYDDAFAARELTPAQSLQALKLLAASGLRHGVGDWFEMLRSRRSRGTFGASVSERLRWTAGMVFQWAQDTALREQLRKQLADAIKASDPHLIVAHSLGSLIAYDAFVQAGVAVDERASDDEPHDCPPLLHQRVFVSFGSQIGNSFVRAQFGGRIQPLHCGHWYHLYNPHDDIFTARLDIAADNFEQVDTPFDLRGIADHDAAHYLEHPAVSDVLWRDLTANKRLRTKQIANRQQVRNLGGFTRRALLIGINDYEDPSMRLEGCVNDVFLVSQTLQQAGFDADGIRTVLNQRATANGIRDRLDWLLDGMRPGDERVLYYSGHGAQLADYGLDETVDRRDECLVPVDFDWSREMAITDDFLYELYSQLPYDCRLMIVLDCCHSGGMARLGGGRPRGLTPPDDIRHRELRWAPERSRWEPRTLHGPNESLTRWPEYAGSQGNIHRLGRAIDLRQLETRAYNQVRKRSGHYGPYLPLILQACAESELAFEYRHGANSYGAFTHALVQTLAAAAGQGMTYHAWVEATARILDDQNFAQTPQLVGPEVILQQPVLLNPTGLSVTRAD